MDSGPACIAPVCRDAHRRERVARYRKTFNLNRRGVLNKVTRHMLRSKSRAIASRAAVMSVTCLNSQPNNAKLGDPGAGARGFALPRKLDDIRFNAP